MVDVTHSVVAPGISQIFVPVAENNGLIHHLGAWVLRCACAQLAMWDARGAHVGYVSVNVSPVQFSHPGFADQVRSALDSTGRERWLSHCFEVVELHVRPTAQGHGIGSRQLRALLEWLDLIEQSADRAARAAARLALPPKPLARKQSIRR